MNSWEKRSANHEHTPSNILKKYTNIMRYCKCGKIFENVDEILKHISNSDLEHYEVKSNWTLINRIKIVWN